jgi:hypothetical protein
MSSPLLLSFHSFSCLFDMFVLIVLKKTLLFDKRPEGTIIYTILKYSFVILIAYCVIDTYNCYITKF